MIDKRRKKPRKGPGQMTTQSPQEKQEKEKVQDKPLGLEKQQSTIGGTLQSAKSLAKFGGKFLAGSALVITFSSSLPL